MTLIDIGLMTSSLYSNASVNSLKSYYFIYKLFFIRCNVLPRCRPSAPKIWFSLPICEHWRMTLLILIHEKKPHMSSDVKHQLKPQWAVSSLILFWFTSLVEIFSKSSLTYVPVRRNLPCLLSLCPCLAVFTKGPVQSFKSHQATRGGNDNLLCIH